MSKRNRNRQSAQSSAPTVTAIPTHSSLTPAPAKTAIKLRSMDQERAQFALRKIESIAASEKPDIQKEIRSHLNNLPALIRMNGLGQALAFCQVKAAKDSGQSYKSIYPIISTWLCAPDSQGRIFDENNDVIQAITQSDIQKYMAAQNEALALLEWLKKFALALLEKGAD